MAAKIICISNSGAFGDCDRNCLIGNFDLNLSRWNWYEGKSSEGGLGDESTINHNHYYESLIITNLKID